MGRRMGIQGAEAEAVAQGSVAAMQLVLVQVELRLLGS